MINIQAYNTIAGIGPDIDLSIPFSYGPVSIFPRLKHPAVGSFRLLRKAQQDIKQTTTFSTVSSIRGAFFQPDVKEIKHYFKKPNDYHHLEPKLISENRCTKSFTPQVAHIIGETKVKEIKHQSDVKEIKHKCENSCSWPRGPQTRLREKARYLNNTTFDISCTQQNDCNPSRSDRNDCSFHLAQKAIVLMYTAECTKLIEIPKGKCRFSSPPQAADRARQLPSELSLAAGTPRSGVSEMKPTEPAARQQETKVLNSCIFSSIRDMIKVAPRVSASVICGWERSGGPSENKFFLSCTSNYFHYCAFSGVLSLIFIIVHFVLYFHLFSFMGINLCTSGKKTRTIRRFCALLSPFKRYQPPQATTSRTIPGNPFCTRMNVCREQNFSTLEKANSI